FAHGSNSWQQLTLLVQLSTTEKPFLFRKHHHCHPAPIASIDYKSKLRKIKIGEKKRPRLDIQRKSSSSSNGQTKANKSSRTKFQDRPILADISPNDRPPASIANKLKSITSQRPSSIEQPPKPKDNVELLSDDSDSVVPLPLPDDELHPKKVSFASAPQYFHLSSDASNSSRKSTSAGEPLSPVRTNARADPESSESDDDNAYDTGMMSPSDNSQALSPRPMEVGSHDETPAERDSVGCNATDAPHEEPELSQEMFSQNVQPPGSQKNIDSQPSSSSVEIFETSVVLDTEHPDASLVVTELLRAMLDRRGGTKCPEVGETIQRNPVAGSKLSAASSKKISFHDITNRTGLEASQPDASRLNIIANADTVFQQKPIASFEFPKRSMANLLPFETTMKKNLDSAEDPSQNVKCLSNLKFPTDQIFSPRFQTQRSNTGEISKSSSSVQFEAALGEESQISAQDSIRSNAGSDSPMLNPIIGETEDLQQYNSDFAHGSQNSLPAFARNMDEAQILFDESNSSSNDWQTGELSFHRFPSTSADLAQRDFGVRSEKPPKVRGRSKFSSFLPLKKRQVSQLKSSFESRGQDHPRLLGSSNELLEKSSPSAEVPILAPSQSLSQSVHLDRFGSSRYRDDIDRHTSSNTIERSSNCKFPFGSSWKSAGDSSDDDDKENRPPNFGTPSTGRSFENTYAEYLSVLRRGSSSQCTQSHSGPSQSY
ncbi:unnamed protein product, partial [Nesidiocoris tenuis]